MTATLTEPFTIPGMYDISADEYHADPVPGGSLSSSGARLLLPPNCPARYHYNRLNPPAPKAVYDLGHAAHRLALGAGAEIVKVEADDWRTKAAKEQRDEAHDAGKTPLLRDDYARVEAMAAALRHHPMAAALFNPDRGAAERALIWQDGESGVWRRALVDFLPWRTTGRLIVADYKTCRSADPEMLQRSMHDYGYNQQGAWYLDGVRAVAGGGPDTTFVFVFQEKEPPYLVTVAQPSAFALLVGRDLNRQAIDIYAECVRTGEWPGYSDEVETIPLPAWVENRYKELT